MAKTKVVYIITGRGERKFWTKVGIAFVNRDGSLNVKLDCLPVDGELHIRDQTRPGDIPPTQASYPSDDGDDIKF